MTQGNAGPSRGSRRCHREELCGASGAGAGFTEQPCCQVTTGAGDAIRSLKLRRSRHGPSRRLAARRRPLTKRPGHRRPGRPREVRPEDVKEVAMACFATADTGYEPRRQCLGRRGRARMEAVALP